MLEKNEKKNKTIGSKITDSQNEKLEKLAKKFEITKSNLISQLLAEGYKSITKNKTF
jgi:hypothetical protein